MSQTSRADDMFRRKKSHAPRSEWVRLLFAHFMLRPIFYQAWVATPQSCLQAYAGPSLPDGTSAVPVHAWIFLCREPGLSDRTRAQLPETVRSRAFVFSSLTSQLNDLLRLMHRLLQRGISVAVVCETGKQRAPTLWAAYLLWQTQLQLDTVLRVFRDAHPYMFSPGPLYLDLLQYVERHRRNII